MPRKTTGHQRPKQRSAVRDSKAEFYYRFEMITRDEYEACQRGDAVFEIRQGVNYLLNLNAKLTFPTGVKEKIYPGRAVDIGVKQLLGLFDEN